MSYLVIFTKYVTLITVTWSFENKNKIRKTSKNFGHLKIIDDQNFSKFFLFFFYFRNFKWLCSDTVIFIVVPFLSQTSDQVPITDIL